MSDDLNLDALYSAADALVIPSHQDNLLNTGVEANACGTSVVACNTTGLPDIVEHQGTRYLARALYTEDLAHGIAWVLVQQATGPSGGLLGKKARERAEGRFAASVVAQKDLSLYVSI